MRVLVAVVFIAACAYIGAALFGSTPASDAVTAVCGTAADSTKLRGIAVRSEQCISSELAASRTAPDGLKIPCGGTAAVLSDGERISVPCSAVFFTDTDGYEGLSPGMLQGIRAERLRAVLALPSDNAPAIGRIVCDSVWYYAALADADYVFPDSESCLLRFDGTAEYVPASIISVSEPSDGERAVVFRLNCGGDYLKLRQAEAEAVFSIYRGIIIPASAVAETSDGSKFVYTVSDGVIRRSRIQIIYTSAQQCVVSQLSSPDCLQPGDRVIISAADYQEREG